MSIAVRARLLAEPPAVHAKLAKAFGHPGGAALADRGARFGDEQCEALRAVPFADAPAAGRLAHAPALAEL